MLSVDSLSVDRDARRVVDGVSFTLSAGEILVVVGANGAGKTTLLDGVLGFIPARGRVMWNGDPLQTLAQRAKVFSCMPDEAEPPPEVRVATQLSNDAQLEDRLGLRKLRSARAGELSRGEKRRLLLHAALSTSRPVAVLDEPLGTFDPLQLVDVLSILRERAAAGTALVLSVHQMSDAEKIASRVLILDRGKRLALGTLDELRARTGATSLEQVFLALLKEAHAAA